jgi:hypothetical protein
VALSNHPAWQVTQALWIADDRRLAAAPVCAQVEFNLIDRAAEDKLVPACQQFGLLRRRAAAGDAIRPARLDHLRRCDPSGQTKPGRLALRDQSARPMTCSQPDLRPCPKERVNDFADFFHRSARSVFLACFWPYGWP